MKTYNYITLNLLICMGLFACSGSGGSGSTTSSGGGGGGNPNPAVSGQSLMLGNVTPIPVVDGAIAGIVPMVVTNNTSLQLSLQAATIVGSDIGTVNVVNQNLYVDTSQCSIVNANYGQCNVNLLGYGVNPNLSYTINMTFVDNNNHLYQASQIITYSSHIPTTTTPGGITMAISSTNNNIYKAPQTRTSITIPFVLGATYPDLSVSSTIPSIQPGVVCANNSYTSGSSCYIIATIGNVGNNQQISSSINLSSSGSGSNFSLPNGEASQNLMSQNVQLASSNPTTGIPITVVQNNVGNLITSGVNVVINPSNGSVPQTVWVLNNGNTTLASLAFSAANNQVQISTAGGPSPCGAATTLNPNVSCSFTVNSVATTSGQTSVFIDYTSTAGGTAMHLPFNVIYIAESAAPLLTMTTGLGSLSYVPTATTAYLPILVSNQSNESTTFTNLQFGPLPTAEFSYVPQSGGSSCNPAGGSSLSPSATCTLIIAYTPTSAGESSSFNDYATANYIDQGGNPQTYEASALNIPYSSIANAALVMIIPDNVAYAIRADGVTSGTESFTIVNYGGTSTTLPTLTTANFIPNTFPITFLSNSCSGVTLAAGASCGINFTYGPTTTAYTNLAESFQFNYKPYSSSTSVVAAYSFQTFNTSLATLITITAISESQTNGVAVTGNGVSNSTPFGGSGNYVASPNSLLWATLTYTNNGSESATNFNVALNTLPVGAESIAPITCPTGISTGTLAANGGSCTVTIAIVNPNGSYNPYITNWGPTNIAFPGWSATESINGSASVIANPTPTGPSGPLSGLSAFYMTGSSYVSTTSAIAAASIPGTGTTVAESVVVTFTATGPTATPTNFPLTVQMVPAGSLQYSASTCNIATSGGTCPITITFPSGSVSESYSLSYIVTPNGTTAGASTGISGYFTAHP